jgi:hypothetical protein
MRDSIWLSQTVLSAMTALDVGRGCLVIHTIKLMQRAEFLDLLYEGRDGAERVLNATGEVIECERDKVTANSTGHGHASVYVCPQAQERL